VDLRTVQDMLGHSSIVLTADTYTSVLPDVARAAAEKVAALIIKADCLVPGTRRRRRRQAGRSQRRSHAGRHQRTAPAPARTARSADRAAAGETALDKHPQTPALLGPAGPIAMTSRSGREANRRHQRPAGRYDTPGQG